MIVDATVSLYDECRLDTEKPAIMVAVPSILHRRTFPIVLTTFIILITAICARATPELKGQATRSAASSEIV